MGSEHHKAGTNDGWHGVIAPGEYFGPEKDRYHLYLGKTPRNRQATMGMGDDPLPAYRLLMSMSKAFSVPLPIVRPWSDT